MFLLRRIFSAFVLLFSVLSAQSQLQIINSTNANALAQKLVGSGVSISNATIVAGPGASAFFRHLGGTQLNLDSGIVLSTGRAQTLTTWGLNGPASQEASTDQFLPGDFDLDALPSIGTLGTNDAVVLEFDFVPLGDSIKFNYVFSSEEYPDFVCTQYNDVFAFFISGPGITGLKNIALVPGTTTPVAINSINDGTDPNLSFCQTMYPGGPFIQYFVNNSTSNLFTHNGHTTVLTAKEQVTPCQTYHLKIAIADVSDGILDSGVFLEAGSLTSDPLKIETNLPSSSSGEPYMVEGCNPGAIHIFRSKKKPAAQTVNLVFGGNAINGTDVQTIPSTISIPANDSVVILPLIPIVDGISEGTDSLKIYISSGCAAAGLAYLDSLTVYIRDYDTLNITPPDTIACNNVPIQINATGNFNSIQWSPVTGLSNASIANPVATVLQPTTYIATASMGSCLSMDSVKLNVKSLQLLSTQDVLCKDGNTGQIRVSGGALWKSPVQYNINNQPYGTDSTFNNLTVGTYTVRVKDVTGCIDSLVVNVVQSYPDLEFTDSLVTASCTGTNGEAYLFASGGLAPYSYTVDSNPYGSASNFMVNGGNHTLSVKDANGCIANKPVTITNDPPITFTLTPSQVLCDGSASGYVYVDANGGSTQYEYSIDGTNFQLADSFLISVSPVTVTVRDNKGCTKTNTFNIPINAPVFINAGNDTTICEGKSVQFNSAYNADTFIWTSNSSLSATNVPNPVASPVSTTTYYVMVTKDVCVARDTITVSVWPAPVAQAGPDSTICFGRTMDLNGAGGYSYAWTPASALSDPTIASPTIVPDKTTILYLEVSDVNGCKSLKKDTVVITVTPPLQVFAGADTSIAVGQALQLIGTQLNGSTGTIFSWSPSTGLNDPTILNPVATIQDNITYTLTISTPEGCKGSDQVVVRVFSSPEIYVPNGFTPNADGKNDLLRAIPVGIKKFNYFRVFNRWGQQIFATTNANMGWDGKINGMNQPTGTYVWIAEGVDFGGNKLFRKGTVTLIR